MPYYQHPVPKKSVPWLLQLIVIATLIIIPIATAHAQTSDPASGEDETTGSGFDRGLNIITRDIATPDSGLVPGSRDITEIITTVINWFLGLMAITALAVLLWGSFSYITSLGNEKKTEAAKRIIVFAIVGLLLVGLSFLIITTVKGFLTGDAGSGGASGGGAPAGGGGTLPASAPVDPPPDPVV